MNKKQLIRFCLKNEVEVLNFHYCGFDGRLKTLNFALRDKAHLVELLEAGERVDGSSLFPFIEAGRSDLYVVPRYETAFLNPLEDVPTVDVLCTFFDRDGKPYDAAPQQVLHRAAEAFRKVAGMEMYAMGELEYYAIGDEEPLFPVADQKGYHESKPYNKFADMRIDAMLALTQAGCSIKYGHSEVGNFTEDGRIYEQNEIEFTPVPVEQAADQLVLAQWMMKQIAYSYGIDISFAPKLKTGKAGSGLHVHMKFERAGRNMLVTDGEITPTARKAIAGLMDLGTSLPAWGNPSTDSFRRLVPHQEAPTSLCWSFSNRSALVRVPLGWNFRADMAAQCNPGQKSRCKDYSCKQTFEWRASDATADIYLLMSALCVAARHGLEMEGALELAEKTYVGLGVNIHDASNAALMESLRQLPASTAGAAERLAADRAVYEAYGVFPASLVDYQINYLTSLK
ncbi:MAG: glutamine synthetase [Bacteroidales bacterium]|nr:glutamine synthetase [Candidatus Cryptobacteroides aphodequi]